MPAESLAPLVDHPFPERTSVVHELGHLFISAIFAPRTDGIIFFARNPGTIALASYTKDRVTASRRLAIAVAGAVAAHDSAAVGSLGAQPKPEDVFGADCDELFPEFYGDRETVRAFTANLDAVKKRSAIERAIARARRELEILGGAPLLIAATDGILGWLESNDRAKWHEALEQPGPHASVFFGHRAVIQLMARIAEEQRLLTAGAGRIQALIEEQWARAERERLGALRRGGSRRR